jgi:hypothetical protein
MGDQRSVFKSSGQNFPKFDENIHHRKKLNKSLILQGNKNTETQTDT